MRIDADKPIPKYLQLKEILTRHFREQHYQPDQKVPTENELIEQFDVSRNTVRQALAELANDGVIYKIQGSGSFFSGNSQPSQKSHLIGVITPLISSYIYPQIIQGIDDVAHQKQYNILLGSSDINPQKERIRLQQMLEKEIDGLLIEPSGGCPGFEHSDIFQALKHLAIPVVFMDWTLNDPEISYVSLDDFEGGFRATSYLVEAGHTRIAFAHPNDTIPALRRYEGYKRALAGHGIPYNSRFDASITIAEWNEPHRISMLVKELLEPGKERPTAIFFFNDDGALQGYDAIREIGLRVPDDISVVGFDDSEMAARAEVSLTTMIHPKYQLGKWAAELLFNQIEGGGHSTPNQVILNPRIAVRKSVKHLTR
jgi:GntR family transcriptional regulator of arabinose operon